MKKRYNYLSKDQLFILAMLGFWILLGLVDFFRNALIFIAGQNDAFSLQRSLLFISSYIISWSALTYPILILFKKTRNYSWGLKIITHIFFSILFGFLQYIFTRFLGALFQFEGGSFWDFWVSYMRYPLIGTLSETLVYWVVMFLLLILDYYNKFKEASLHSSKLETQLAQSKLQALRMQLHPHFLFNALNTISMLVRRKQNNDAVNMISGLSEMLRTALGSTETATVTLKEELSLLKKYLDIEQIRFKDTLTVKFDIEESALYCKVPSLVLQPLVENAFKHGISKFMGDSVLEISATQQNNHLLITIFNSGQDLPPDWDIHKNRGVGLSNTVDRLETLYGNEYQFILESKVDKGIEVKLKIPKNI